LENGVAERINAKSVLETSNQTRLSLRKRRILQRMAQAGTDGVFSSTHCSAFPIITRPENQPIELSRQTQNITRMDEIRVG
jgi:hypothetical protein